MVRLPHPFGKPGSGPCFSAAPPPVNLAGLGRSPRSGAGSHRSPTRVVNGSTAVSEALRSLGVECVFGLPGTQTVELFEALRASRIRTVLATHELAAAFMANGYARGSGRAGVVVTIPGPGFTWAMTGIAEASLDSAAVVHLVGPSAVVPGRRFQLQAIDQAGIAGPLVKAYVRVAVDREGGPESTARVAARLGSAFGVALEGGPGPVVVELVGARVAEGPDVSRSAAPTPDWDPIRRRFEASRTPALLVGQGALDDAAPLQRFAERHSIPVLTTPSARGALPEDHRLAMGFDVLRGGVEHANALLDRADLVLALGARLGHNGSAGFRLALPPDRLVHVDADAAVPGASYPAHLTAVATVARALEALAEVPPSARANGWSDDEVAGWRRDMRAGDASPGAEPSVRGWEDESLRGFFAWLRAELPREGVLVTDSGLHQVLARKYFDVLAPRGLLAPSDFQSMGFGLPAAIGAKLAAPLRPVALVMGDGGFLMSGMEVLTAARERVPLPIFVFNDGQLGQIRIQQLANHGRTHAVELRNPDFALLAESFGVPHVVFGEHRPQDFQEALTRPGPTLFEVRLGDSWPLLRKRVVGGAKAAARRALGDRGTGLLKRLLGGSPAGRRDGGAPKPR